jgi:hypothetical protein
MYLILIPKDLVKNMTPIQDIVGCWFMVLNTTFNNIPYDHDYDDPHILMIILIRL